MTEQEIKLLIHEKTDELLGRQSSRSIWRNVFVTIIILPLVYFGVEALAEKAARDAASEALKNQEQAWAAVYSEIAQGAVMSATSAEAANLSASNAKLRAEDAAEKLESAAANISTTLGFEGPEDVTRAIIASAEIQNKIQVASQIRVGNCQSTVGACGEGMFHQPTYYLDRVEFSCPGERPILKEFRFKRCGAINQSSEGLQLVATCCALALGEGK